MEKKYIHDGKLTLLINLWAYVSLQVHEYSRQNLGIRRPEAVAFGQKLCISYIFTDFSYGISTEYLKKVFQLPRKKF